MTGSRRVAVPWIGEERTLAPSVESVVAGHRSAVGYAGLRLTSQTAMQTPISGGNGSTAHQPVDVFLSYASVDGGVARLLAEELTSLGYEVWWDRLIPSGARWDDEIERRLEAARFVVVLWSPAAADSDYVRAEARAASRRGTLISAVIEPCELPMPFGEFQAIDLVPWRASGETAAVDDLRRALAGPPVAGAKGLASGVVERVEDSPQRDTINRSKTCPRSCVSSRSFAFASGGKAIICRMT